MSIETGNIAVQTENIFPIIKKFLYSDHEIFLRELVANAVDATQKLRKLSSMGEIGGELGDTNIRISIDKEAGTLTISDRGIGMSGDEVKRYINQVALSSASEFLDKYKGLEDGKSIIGHFGLGFYSAFMVADQVALVTRSAREGHDAVRWTCDGSPQFTLEVVEKETRGTDVILYINEENKEFLEDNRIQTLLDKYCKFLPVPIQFGESVTKEKDEAGNETEVTAPRIINNPNPAWTKKPAELTDEDYTNFYRELYPYAEVPMFWIHLNVDYPFNLTGILYFPRIKKSYEIQKNKIHLYSNQVFVTDEVNAVVPEWLTLLHGVIDSPDIPLNVSRSYLQSDQNVKKINSYITKKVAEKLEELFKKDRAAFEEKWENINVIIKYGMLSDEKFFERGEKFCLLQNTEKKFFTLDEYKAHIAPAQEDKNKQVIALYTNNVTDHHVYVDAAINKGYDVLEIDNVIDNHFISFIEQKMTGVQFKRVDADTIDQLIDKDEKIESVLSDTEQTSVKELFEQVVDANAGTVVLTPMSPNDQPVTITKPEFMRRMKEMSHLNGMDFAASMPDQFNLVINTNHPVVNKMLQLDEAHRLNTARQLHDLALLSQGMLKGTALTEFVKRSVEQMQ
ncbi:MAG TPA: molecular chaperone HtpG [Chitinophagales bacterium]|nr:molecular chaperone HtpG [Chitinophagales bacterium]HNJ88670.1 molecular chaperone HtpG [Chitinophagales bacterium]HNO28257.1 molecular chaperone HtpG [Chitinophagales bacterium]